MQFTLSLVISRAIDWVVGIPQWFIDKWNGAWPEDSDVYDRAQDGLPLTVAGRDVYVYAGPFRRAPHDDASVYKICLAPEVLDRFDLEADWVVDWPDFGIPTRDDVGVALSSAITHLEAGREVYVGCMGGIGRTGTFLSLLAKLNGVDEPLKYVREHYLTHAVETKEQEQFIADF